MADFSEQKLSRKQYVEKLKKLSDEELFSHYNRGPFPYDTENGYTFDYDLAYAEIVRREGKKPKAPQVRNSRLRMQDTMEAFADTSTTFTSYRNVPPVPVPRRRRTAAQVREALNITRTGRVDR